MSARPRVAVTLLSTGSRSTAESVLGYLRNILQHQTTPDKNLRPGVRKNSQALGGDDVNVGLCPTLEQPLSCQSPLAAGHVDEVGMVSDIAGNTITVCRVENISRVRQVAGKKDLVRVADVTLSTPSGSKPHASRDYSLHKSHLFRLAFGNSAALEPRICFIPQGGTNETPPDDRETSHTWPELTLKEIVLGCGDDMSRINGLCHTALPASWGTKSPALWRAGNKSNYVRFIPSRHSTMVLHVPSLERLPGNLTGHQTSKIGYSGSRAGQLQLHTPFSGLSIRLCASPQVAPWHFEGSESVMENVVPGVGDVPHDTQLGCGQVLRKEFAGAASMDKL